MAWKNYGKTQINRATASRNPGMQAKSRVGKVMLTHPRAILSVRITGRLYITSTSQTRAALPSRKRRTQWCTKLGTMIFDTSFAFLRWKLNDTLQHGSWKTSWCYATLENSTISVWQLKEQRVFTFPNFWCSSNAAISAVAHLILSGLGANSSWTALIWLGWITCFPGRKNIHHEN